MVEREPEGKMATLRLWFQLLRGLRREERGDPIGYLFILPGLLAFLIFQVYPIVRGIWMAFTDYRFLIPGYEPFVGVGNFVEAFTQDSLFWPTFRRSLHFTAIYLPTELLLGLAFASIIGLVKNAKVAGFYRTIIYLPVILPVAVAMLMWKEMFNNQYGFVNHLIGAWLHLPQLRQPWLSVPRWTVPVVAVSRIWKDAGFAALLFLIGIYNINRELYEAAEIDGASTWQQWWSITLPLLKPITTLVLVLNAGVASAAQEFMITYGSYFGPEQSALTLGYYIWTIAFKWGDLRLGYAAAMSLFLGVLAMIMTGVIFALLRTEKA